MLQRIQVLCLLCLLGLGGVTNAVAKIPQKPVLNLELARLIARAAEAEASQQGWNVVITVTDEGGHPLYLLRMDSTQIGSVQVALDKARSAVFFKRPTRSFEDVIADGGHAYLALPGTLPLEGGVPLFVAGHLVGAIGVSGVTARQDGIIAAAGASALEEHVR